MNSDNNMTNQSIIIDKRIATIAILDSYILVTS